MRAVLLGPAMGDYYRRSPVRPAITLSPPLNLALLAASLRRAGVRVQVWDMEAQPEVDLAQELRRSRPELVGITARTPLFPAARELALAARSACPEALLVAGGVHASTLPEQTLRHAPFDCAVRGEGDHAIAELASGRPFREIPGLSWRDGATPDRPPIQHLDELPMPAWDLFDLRRYRRPSLVAPALPVADLESSRGCRARCVYCTKGVFGSDFRVKSPARFVDEIEHALSSGFAAFNLVDDSFTHVTSRAVAVCEEILARGLRVPWTLTNGIRVGNVNREFFRIARRSGCRLVAFGFESGSDRTLRRIGKGATVAQARRAVAWARENDLTILGYFMVGLPGETARDVMQTAAFAASLDIDFAKFSITHPLPGTPLYERWCPGAAGAESWDFSIHRVQGRTFAHPDFAWPELEALTRRAYRVFYGRPRYLLRHLGRALRRGDLPREARLAFDGAAMPVARAMLAGFQPPEPRCAPSSSRSCSPPATPARSRTPAARTSPVTPSTTRRPR